MDSIAEKLMISGKIVLIKHMGHSALFSNIKNTPFLHVSSHNMNKTHDHAFKCKEVSPKMCVRDSQCSL